MMDFATAQTCVLKEIERARNTGASALHITFMGGEPFMNFPVIRQVVEWVETLDVGLRFEASATTNGTLVTEETKEWLRRHYHIFKVQVSYDGTALMQQKNRTHTPIDLDFFLQTYPVQGVHVTVSQRTLPQLYEGVLFLIEKGARCSTTLAYGTKWTEEDAAIYLRELRILSDVYLTQHPDVEPLPVLTNSLMSIGSAPVSKSMCGAGADKVTYDVDGEAYGCHLFSPIVVGKEKACKLCDFDIFKLGGTEDWGCISCPLCNWCNTCYGFNYLLTGSTGLKDHSICKMMFAQALAASEYQLKRVDVHQDRGVLEKIKRTHQLLSMKLAR